MFTVEDRERVRERLIELAEEDPSVAAAAITGSYVAGGGDEWSDIDLAFAIRGELAPALKHWTELLYRDFAALHHWDLPFASTYLDHGARALIESPHCNTLVVRWIVRERGIALAGPQPRRLIAPVRVRALRGEILRTIVEWGREIAAHPDRYNNRFYQTFIVLSYCRMLHDLHAGSIGSKRTGAEWAKRNLDPSWVGLIDRAWDGRPKPAESVRQPADPDDFEATLKFVQYVGDKASRQQASGAARS